MISALQKQLLQREEENRQLQEEVQISKNMFETLSLQLDQMTEEAGKKDYANHKDGGNTGSGEDVGKEEVERMKKTMHELEERNSELESQSQLSFLRMTALE